MESMYDCYKLNNGVRIPCIGFGTYKAAAGNGAEGIETALRAGYRYFDTAAFYQNEEDIGRAVIRSGIDRKELFLSSKVWSGDLGEEGTRRSFENSLEKLQTDYLDLYLIHWPCPNHDYKDWKHLVLETWKVMEELCREGRIRAAGVSNFLPQHLEVLAENSEMVPAVDQIEFHPGHTQEMTVSYCQERGIIVQAWSPLGRKRVLEHELLTELSEKYGVSPAQLCIRYAVQRGVIPLPKASSYDRMKQNQDVFGFEISREDMYRIGTMPPAGWSGEHPDFVRVRF